MEQNHKNLTVFLMIFLVVSLPFYISNVMAQEGNESNNSEGTKEN